MYEPANDAIILVRATPSTGGVMQFDDSNVDVSGVDDQRGGGGRGVGGPIAIGGGGVGIVGLLVFLLVTVLGGGGVDPAQIVPGSGQVQEGGAGTGSTSGDR